MERPIPASNFKERPSVVMLATLIRKGHIPLLEFEKWTVLVCQGRVANVKGKKVQQQVQTTRRLP
jgi:hypothetical protein